MPQFEPPGRVLRFYNVGIATAGIQAKRQRLSLQRFRRRCEDMPGLAQGMASVKMLRIWIISDPDFRAKTASIGLRLK